MTPEPWEKFVKNRERIERLRVVCPMKDCGRIMDSMHEPGFRFSQSGPYTDKNLFPKVDDTRFWFIAEREMQ